MTSMSTPSVLPRTWASEGYVHKFRFESEPVIVMPQESVIDVPPTGPNDAAATTKERRLLLGFLASVVGLSALLLGVVWLMQS